MADDYGNYDPRAGLGSLLGAVLNYDMTSASRYAGRLGLHLGVTGDDSDKTLTGKLREALGLKVTGRCELVSALRGTPCTEPVIARRTGACAHGHVTERQVCEGHGAPEVLLWCRACYRLPGTGAHECPVTFAAEQAEAAQSAGTEN